MYFWTWVTILWASFYAASATGFTECPVCLLLGGVGGFVIGKKPCKEGFCGTTCQISEEVTEEACPCPLTNSVCADNKCVCRCGYRYRRGICSRDCDLADSFTTFPNKLLQGVDAISQRFDFDSAAECRSFCLSNDDCLSAEFCPNDMITGPFCEIYPVTKDDGVQLKEDGGRGCEFSQRNCQ